MRKEIDSQQGLYRESFEHDNCGIGAIVNIKGVKSHSTVAGALRIVEHLEHRAGKDAEGKDRRRSRNSSAGFPQVLSARSVSLLASLLAARGITEWGCSFFLRMS